MQKHVLGFMVSAPGRVVHIVAGIGLIVVGLFFNSGVTGYIVAVAGLAVIVVSASDTCMVAPVCGLSSQGNQTRAQLDKPAR